MKKVLLYFGRCAVWGVAGLALLALLLRTPLFAGLTIYYYRVLCLVVVITVVVLAILLAGKNLFSGSKFWNIEPVELFSTTALICVCLLFVVTVASMPIDRSYTIYSLADMADHANRIYSMDEVKDSFVDGYIDKLDATQRRVKEQVSSGNLKEVNGGYQITEKGLRLVKMLRMYEAIFPVSERRLLYPDGTNG